MNTKTIKTELQEYIIEALQDVKKDDILNSREPVNELVLYYLKYHLF